MYILQNCSDTLGIFSEMNISETHLSRHLEFGQGKPLLKTFDISFLYN